MMLNLNMRTILMIAIAVIAATLTALMARGWLNAERAALGSGQYVYQVLVVKTSVPSGHFIKAQELRWQGWPKGTLASSYAVKGKRKPEDFDGAVVRRGLVAGQPITDAQVVRPGERGFLAAVLQPGMRAVSIRVNAITGISGFVFPGDRIDMVLTHAVRSEGSRSSRYVSETVMEDVRVLAVDQTTDDQRKGKVSVAKTVTFEVTPKQAEKIGIINKLGKISLSLRSIARETAPVKKKPLVPMATAAKSTPRPSSAGLTPIAGAQASEVPSGVPQAGAKETVVLVKPTPIPKRERAGITMDSEVSRVLGRRATRASRTVRVMRGGSTAEQKF